MTGANGGFRHGESKVLKRALVVVQKIGVNALVAKTPAQLRNDVRVSNRKMIRELISIYCSR